MTLMLSTLKFRKGVDLCLSCSLLPHVSLGGVLKGVLVHAHLAMVLKELDGWKDLDATLWFFSGVFPSTFKQWSWKESLELVFVLFSMAETVIGPNSGIVLFKVVYINKWNTPLEAVWWLHEPTSMYEVTPSCPISTEGVLLNSFSGNTWKQSKLQ